MFTTFLLIRLLTSYSSFFFFFNDTATTEIYTLSLHDALPIYRGTHARAGGVSLRPRHDGREIGLREVVRGLSRRWRGRRRRGGGAHAPAPAQLHQRAV